MSSDMNTSMTPPIQLESISKCYRIFQNPQDRFKQALLDRFQNVLGRKSASSLYREHWALRDVSFELQPGEAVGILGRNGAGKSTLLQIIAGTLEPTSGSVQTTGRITALLELGSGFNPEFTGRENVFLNAQILGLSREDALARFDDIAGFADIGDFIDQPVKTYSSGMMMRLAFAVQTAVEPKVLIVDEALSVGDMFFQAKCMARIRRLVDDGVAILFVSHDVGAVRQLCNRAILLNNGKVMALGETRLVADRYMKHQLEDRNRSAKAATNPDNGQQQIQAALPESRPVKANAVQQCLAVTKDGFGDMGFGQDLFEHRARDGRVENGWAKILNVQMLRDGHQSIEFGFNDEVEIRVFVHFERALSNVNLAVKVRTLQGTDVIFLDTRLQGKFGERYKAQNTYRFSWKARLPLMHGNYALSTGLACPPAIPGDDWTFIDVIPHAFDFQMGARAEGMIGGFIALPASLDVDLVTTQNR